MNRIVMDLQFFAEDGAAAAAAPAETAGGGSAAAVTGTEGPVNIGVGDTLPNGQQVQSAQVAAELARQMKRHPELRKVYGQRPGAQQAPAGAPAEAAPAQAAEAPHEMTIQEKWDQAKKGEFKDLYGADVKAAIQDRFKNQSDAKAQLDELQPMVDILMKKAGAASVQDLIKLVVDDDSNYAEEAEAAGMTIEKYKQFKALQDEHDRRQAEDQQNIEQAMWRDHFSRMAEQAEQMKQRWPDFNLEAEMQNEQFRKLTHPSVGLSVEDAYRTVHWKEIEPQLVAYGMNRAQQQAAQTIQAGKARPVEGAMNSQTAPAAGVRQDFSKMTRPQRDEYRRKVLSGLVRGGDFA